MKITSSFNVSVISLLCFGAMLKADEISPAPNLLISKAGELIFKESGDAPLDPATRFFYGDWKFVEDGMLGTQNERHLATIRTDRDFNDVILQFEIKFLDSGRMSFVSWNKGKGGHSMDAVVNQQTGLLEIIKADQDGPGPDLRVSVAKKGGLKIALNKWYTCIIEQKGDKAALHFDCESIEGQHAFFSAPKFNFFINVGGSQETEKTMIRNIALWKAD